jgi:hypothetical protein
MIIMGFPQGDGGHMWVLGYIIHTHIKPFGHVHKAPNDNNINTCQVYTSHAYDTTLVKRENPRFFRGCFIASRHYRYPMIDHKIK